jgi:hypothetical protein
MVDCKLDPEVDEAAGHSRKSCNRFQDDNGEGFMAISFAQKEEEEEDDASTLHL